MQNSRTIVFFFIIVVLNFANLITLFCLEVKFDSSLNNILKENILTIEFKLGNYESNMFKVSERFYLKAEFLDELKKLSKNATFYKGPSKDLAIYLSRNKIIRLEIHLKDGNVLSIFMTSDLEYIFLNYPIYNKPKGDSSRLTMEKIYSYGK